MSCKICGRGACAASFHSLEAQTAFEEIDSLSEDEAKRELSDAKDEIETLRQRTERAEAERDEAREMYNARIMDISAKMGVIEFQADELEAAQSTIAELAEMLLRYVKEVPLGHQPHMAAEKADRLARAALGRGE